MFTVYLKSAGGTKKYFTEFETEAEAESFCREYGWEWVVYKEAITKKEVERWYDHLGIGETVHMVTVGYRWVIRETAFRYGLLDKYPLDRICRNEHLAKYKVMRLEAYDKRSERKNG